MKLGFTGTRKGMTPSQREGCIRFLADRSPSEMHHGDAIGADAEMHELAAGSNIIIVIHPPSNQSDRAFCKSERVRPEQSYMARNRSIVDESDLVLGIPDDSEISAPRSGTWKTIRYARSCHKPVVIIMPDGEIIETASR